MYAHSAACPALFPGTRPVSPGLSTVLPICSSHSASRVPVSRPSSTRVTKSVRRAFPSVSSDYDMDPAAAARVREKLAAYGPDFVSAA